MVASWDTEFANYPEQTMITVDFSAASQTYLVADYENFNQTDLNKIQAYIDAKQARLDAMQAAKDAAQAELDAQP